MSAAGRLRDRLGEVRFSMSKKFDDLAANAAADWSDDAKRVNKAAGEVFQREVTAQIELGRMLAAAREECHLTQTALAEATGVQQPEISRIENGQANPTLETITRLSTALGRRLELTPAP
jgi:DNA-binding XRE family transcriptional regulator